MKARDRDAHMGAATLCDERMNEEKKVNAIHLLAMSDRREDNER